MDLFKPPFLLSAALLRDFSVESDVSHLPPFVPGLWYIPHRGYITSGSAFTANTIYWVPFDLERAITVSDLGFRAIGTLTDSLVKLAIYENDPTTNRPTGLPLAKTSDITTVAAGNKSGDVVGANVTLPAGLYWAAFWMGGNAIDTGALSLATVSGVGPEYFGGSQAEIAPGSGSYALSSAETYGEFPNADDETFTVLSGLRQYMIHLKAA